MPLDSRHFEDLVDLYYSDLYRFGLSLTRSPDDAGDLVQQTYAILARKHDSVRDWSRIKSWLFTTLYREFTALFRRSRRSVAVDPLETDIGDDRIAHASRSVEHVELLEALQQLDEHHRAVVSLFYLNQHSYKEIATILDVPIGTVMSRLSRAKGQLRQWLERPATRRGPGADADPGGGINIVPFDSPSRKTGTTDE